MKALALTQPWATLVAIGAKTIETRSWETSYRGPLAIHAAKGFPAEAQRVAAGYPFYDALAKAGYHTILDRQGVSHNLPRGCVVATCRLVGCFRITRSATYQLRTGERVEITKLEEAFGDYTPGRWGWVLTDVRAIDPPIPAIGARGLWDWDCPRGLLEGLAR